MKHIVKFLIYGRAESRTTAHSTVLIRIGASVLDLVDREGIGRKIYRLRQDAVKINTCKTVRKLKTLNNKRGRPRSNEIYFARHVY